MYIEQILSAFLLYFFSYVDINWTCWYKLDSVFKVVTLDHDFEAGLPGLCSNTLPQKSKIDQVLGVMSKLILRTVRDSVCVFSD